jgi:2-hydroxy-6-oxonona-2,4-dienedioate hydrolase
MNQSPDRLECRYTIVNGLSMHFRASLSEPAQNYSLPVILVHGFVVSSRYMAPLAKQLAPHFQVYAPDLPGFGKSDKPPQVLNLAELADALAAWMESLGLNRAYLVGNSLGCNILVEFALRHPERVKCLVLQGPTGDPATRSFHQQFARWLLKAWREPRDAALSKITRQDSMAAGPRRIVLTFRDFLQHRMEDKLPHVPVPTLVIRGSRDPIVTQAWAKQMVRLLPQGRLVEMPGGVHTLNYFEPRQFSRLLRVFFKDN